MAKVLASFRQCYRSLSRDRLHQKLGLMASVDNDKEKGRACLPYCVPNSQGSGEAKAQSLIWEVLHKTHQELGIQPASYYSDLISGSAASREQKPDGQPVLPSTLLAEAGDVL